ncbi:MAG: Alpha/beta hydrolase fold precursor [Frankiales bacterium]|nr:Alpha/beta hydrolase fold precursor [Frankiales bacterium]
MARTFDFPSSDGTVVRGWSNEGTGPPVVLANGLGTVPAAWPGLTARGSGYDVVTWYHRGTFGTPRPADPTRIRVEDHVEDLRALMDAVGLERALVASWSVGVNVAFAFAELHPERVSGLLGVAGVPGGTFSTVGGPLRVPRRLRHPVATALARGGRFVGPALTRLAPHVPVGQRLAWAVSHSGFMLPGAPPEVLAPMLREFLAQDWRWYGELALAAAEHEPMDLSFVRCPTTLLAGQHDVLTSVHDVVEAGGRIADAQVQVVPGSHFLPLEHPEAVQDALGALAARAGLPSARA